MAHSMDDAEIRRFLGHGTRTGKLAWTASSGQAHVAPIWFVVDDSAAGLEVVFNTGAQSAKGRAMRRDPRVSPPRRRRAAAVRLRQVDRRGPPQ